MNQFSTERQNKNETVARALALLSLYRKRPEYGVRELARELDMSVAVAQRIVNALCEYRFLIQLKTSRRYILGPACLELAFGFKSQDNFTRICVDHMERLRDQTEESVALHTYRGGLRLCVLESESRQPIRHAMRAGLSFPITNGASDVIIRASVDDEELALIESRLGAAESAAPRPTVEDFKAYAERGWTTSDGARSPGGIAVATRVTHSDAIYVLSVIGPRERMLATGIEKLAKQVMAAAYSLQTALEPYQATL